MEQPEAAEDTRKLRPVKALQHAVQVIDTLAKGPVADGMSVTDLARTTGLSKTAVYNILTTLQATNLIAQDAATSRYRLGWRWYQVGMLLVQGQQLFHVAPAFLDQLVRETSETALLAVVDGDEVTYPDGMESPQAIRFGITPGARGPLHCTATGKVLLAHQPPAFVDRLIRQGLRRYTESTIVHAAALREELARIREEGYGFSHREYVTEHCSVAAPVRDHTGKVRAALGIAGPAYRLESRVEEIVPTLVRLAAGLEEQVGGRPGEGEVA